MQRYVLILSQHDTRQPIHLARLHYSGTTDLITILPKIPRGTKAPVGIRTSSILNTLDIPMNLSVNLLGPDRKVSKRQVPLLVSLSKEDVDLVVSCLFSQAVVTKKMNDVVWTVVVFLSVVGDAIIGQHLDFDADTLERDE